MNNLGLKQPKGLKNLNKGLSKDNTGIPSGRIPKPFSKPFSTKIPKDSSKDYELSQLQKENQQYQDIANAIKQNIANATDDRNTVEKFLNLNQHQGFFGDIMEVLNRPAEGVKSAFIDKNPLEGFWNGIIGKEKPTGLDFAKKVFGFEPTSGFGKFVTEFGIDILTDPLSYIPVTWYAKGAEALKPIFNGAKKLIGATKTGSKILDWSSDLIHTLAMKTKKVFGNYRNKKFLDFKNASTNLDRMLKNTRHEYIDAMSKLKDKVENHIQSVFKTDSPESRNEINKLTGIDTSSKDFNIKDPEVQRIFRKELYSQLGHTVEEAKAYSHRVLFNGFSANGGKTSFAFGANDLEKTYKNLLQAGKVSSEDDFLTKLASGKIKNISKQDLTNLKNINLYRENINSYMKDIAGVEDAVKTDFLGNSVTIGLRDESLLNKFNSNLKNLDHLILQQRKWGMNNGFIASLESLSASGRMIIDFKDPVQVHLFNELRKYLFGNRGVLYSKSIKNALRDLGIKEKNPQNLVKYIFSPLSKEPQGAEFIIPKQVFDDYLKSESGQDFVNYTINRYGNEELRRTNLEITREQYQIQRFIRNYNKWANVQETPNIINYLLTSKSLDLSSPKLWSGYITKYLGKEYGLNKQEISLLKKIKSPKEEFIKSKKIETTIPKLKNQLDKIQKQIAEVKLDNIKQAKTIFSKRRNDFLNAVQNVKNPVDSILRMDITNGEKMGYIFKEQARILKEIPKYSQKLTIPKSEVAFSELYKSNIQLQHIQSNLKNIVTSFNNDLIRLFKDRPEITNVLKAFDTYGYLPHITDINTQKWAVAQEILGSKNSEVSKLLQFSNRTGSKESLLYSRAYLGTARDANEFVRGKIKLGAKDIPESVRNDYFNLDNIINGKTEFFSSSPIEAIATHFLILPEKLLSRNLIFEAEKSGLILKAPDSFKEWFKKRIVPEANKDLTTKPWSKYTLANQYARESKNLAPIKLNNGELLPHKDLSEYVVIDTKINGQIKKALDFLKLPTYGPQDLLPQIEHLEQISESGGFIHEGFLEQLKQYGESFSNEGINKLINQAKQLTQVWKRAALFTTGFHLRNIFSNLTNSYLSGIPLHSYSTRFIKGLKFHFYSQSKLIPFIKNLKMDKRFLDAAYSSKAQYTILENALKEKGYWEDYLKLQEYSSRGIVGTNRIVDDSYEHIKETKYLHNALKVPKNKNNPIVKKLSKIGSGLKRMSDFSLSLVGAEDNASRIAAYEFGKTLRGQKLIKRLKMNTQGSIEANSELFAKTVFFDYQNTTRIEQRYMKNIFPFYTWARKNISLQLKMITNNPQKYIRIHHFIQSMQRAAVLSTQNISNPDDALTQYQKDKLLLPIWDPFAKSNEITLFKINWPFLDLPELPTQLAGRLNPFLKVPLEKLTGTNFFTHDTYTGGIFEGGVSEVFGDAKGLKSFLDLNTPTQKSHLGVFGQRINDIADPLFKIFGKKGGIRGVGDLLPSIFSETDTTENKIYAEAQRNRAIKIWFDRLREQGYYVPTLNELYGTKVPRIRGKFFRPSF